MATVEEHAHSFLPESWPFTEPANTACYTNARLVEHGLPVMRVFHDHDGDWQFLSGDLEEGEACKLVCLGCVYERDKGLAILRSLPPGWMAERHSPDGTWQSEPYERDDEEDEDD